jgi:PAS domain S-box-containing protein
MRPAQFGSDDRRYRLLVESVEDYAIVVLDVDGSVAGWNAGAERIHGFRADEVLGKHVSVLYSSDAVAREQADYDLEQAARHGRYEEESWRTRSDGTRLWARTSITAVRAADERALGFVVVTRDLTVHRRVDQDREDLIEQLRLERRRLRNIFQQAPAFIAVLRGPAHTFELANPAFYQLIGQREIVGTPVADALPELRDQGLLERLDDVYADAKSYIGREARVLLRRVADGPLEERFISFVYQPLAATRGDVTGILVHGVDVTEGVRARTEIEELYQQVAAANQVKSDFLAVISHELRTPLNAIIGYSDLLCDQIYGPLNDRQAEQLERVIASAWHLAHIVDEILAFVGANEHPEMIRNEHVDAIEIARNVTDRVRDEAERKGLSVVLDAPEQGLELYLDGGKLRQILAQLLGNAVKFTDRGVVELSVERTDDTVWFRVRDTGPGIALEDRDRIFEPFTQAQSALTRTVGGTGMGLAIVLRFARLLSGDIAVESEPGKGSAFTLRVPLRTPAGAGSSAA